MANHLLTATVAFQSADDAWQAEINRTMPNLTNARYLPAGKGAPGSILAALHEARETASNAYHAARRAAYAPRPALPRLVAALRLSGHSESEALSAIQARRLCDDFAASESICFVGGASEAIKQARHCRRLTARAIAARAWVQAGLNAIA